MIELRDEFLSEEDLDIRNMTTEELYAYWNMWLQHAQMTNNLDEHKYSHGVFTIEPGPVQEQIKKQGISRYDNKEKR